MLSKHEEGRANKCKLCHSFLGGTLRRHNGFPFETPFVAQNDPILLYTNSIILPTILRFYRNFWKKWSFEIIFYFSNCFDEYVQLHLPLIGNLSWILNHQYMYNYNETLFSNYIHRYNKIRINWFWMRGIAL